MPLGAINMQTEFLGKAIDVARTLNLTHYGVAPCPARMGLVYVSDSLQPLSAAVRAVHILLAMVFSTVMGFLSWNTWKSEETWVAVLG